MDIEELYDFCLSLKGATTSLPFDEDTLVFSVMGKIFCLTNLRDFQSINLKCEPENAILLREKYAEVSSGYHMNKKHWNTVVINGLLSNELIKSWILESYHLVIRKLPQKMQIELSQA